MAKKIIFLIVFVIVSISNTIQPMFFALAIAATSEENENCCNTCIQPVFAALAVLFQSEKYQQNDQLSQCLQAAFDQQKQDIQSMLDQKSIIFCSKKID
jgi:hypothetical protein